MLIMLASLSGGTGGIPVTMLLVAALYLGDQIYAILFVQDNVANFMHIVGGGVRHRLRLLQRLCPAPPPQALRPAKVTLLSQGPAIQSVWLTQRSTVQPKSSVLSIVFWTSSRYNAYISSNGAVSHLRLAAPFVFAAPVPARGR